MAATTPGRNNLDVTTVGQSVIVKAIQGTGIALTSSGADSGTGDVTISINAGVDLALATTQSINVTDAVTNASSNAINLAHLLSSGTVAADFGVGIGLISQTATAGVNRYQATIKTGWINPADTTRTAYLDFQVVNSAVIGSKMRLFGSGGLSVNSTTDPGAGIISAGGVTTTGAIVAGTTISTQAGQITSTSASSPGFILNTTSAINSRTSILFEKNSTVLWQVGTDVASSNDGAFYIYDQSAGFRLTINTAGLVTMGGGVSTSTVTASGAISCSSITTTAGVTSGGGIIGDTCALTQTDANVSFILPLTVSHNTTGTPAVGMGVGAEFRAETSTTNDTRMGRIYWQWNDVVHATRGSNITLTNIQNTVDTVVAKFFASGGTCLSGSLTDPGAGWVTAPAGYKVSGTNIIGGTANQLQYNNGTTLGGMSATTDGTNITMAAGSTLAMGGGSTITFGATTGFDALQLYSTTYGIGMQGSEMQFHVGTAGHFCWNSTGVLQPSSTNATMTLSAAGGLTTAAGIAAGAGITGDSVFLTLTDAVTNTISTGVTLAHNSTGTPVANFGTNLEYRAQTTGTGGVTNALIGRLYWQWSDINHPTRTGYFTIAGYQNAVFTTYMQLFGSGGVGFGVGDPGANYIGVPAGGGLKVGGVVVGPNKVTTLTAASGTYTVPAGVRAIYVECVGGGGGGGAATASASTCALGAGGGGGGYAALMITAPAASYIYAVGAGGAGGTAGGTGGAGGATTFSTISAGGGGGGNGAPTGGSSLAFTLNGAVGGTASGGNINAIGGDAGKPLRLSGTNGCSGDGGESVFGGRAAGTQGDGVGGAGSAYGGGGAGACAYTATARAGGAGAAGIIRVWEFY